MVWGPQAGYFATRSQVPMSVTLPPLPRALALDIPFEFAIAMGVRRGDDALKGKLDDVIARRAKDIDRILDEFSVPRVDPRSAP